MESSSSHHTITLTNKKIYDFYKTHKNLNIEEINLFFIDILEKVQENAPTVSASVSRQILDSITTLQNQFNSFNSKINSVNDGFSKMQQDMVSNFALKLNEAKREYIDELKNSITVNNPTEKIGAIVEKHNELLQDKTRILIHEMGLKNEENITKQILQNIKSFQDMVAQLSRSQINKEDMDSKFEKSLASSQNLLMTLLSNSEQRITTRITDMGCESSKKINELKDISSANHGIQTQLHTNLEEFLRRMENSSAKGKISENMLYNILQNIYPSAEIDYVGTTKETGDIILKRKNKINILFENKNYDTTVGKSEVDKFYRDIDTQKCNGIFLSQKSSISGKSNFEIEIYKNNIVIFLHNLQYDADKVRVAVEILDHLQEQLNEFADDTDKSNLIELNKSFLEELNQEFQDFLMEKQNHIKSIKDYSQKLVTQAENLRIMSLEMLLNKYFSSSLTNKSFNCEYCNYVAKNQRALAAHQRGCDGKKTKEALVYGGATSGGSAPLPVPAAAGGAAAVKPAAGSTPPISFSTISASTGVKKTIVPVKKST